jgi:hypothetical protein
MLRLVRRPEKQELRRQRQPKRMRDGVPLRVIKLGEVG